MATDTWNDDRILTKDEKLDLGNLYYKKDIEEQIEKILDTISFHKVDLC